VEPKPGKQQVLLEVVHFYCDIGNAAGSMSGVDLAALFRVRKRITGFRTRSWPDKVFIVKTTGLALLILTILSVLRGSLVLLYTPAAVVVRLLNIRFPYSHALAPNFGHLAVDPGFYLKAQAISARPVRRAVLVVSRGKISNRFLLDLWSSKYRVVSHPILVTLLTPFKWSRLTGTPIYVLRNQVTSVHGQLLEYGPALDEIQYQFEVSNGSGPLLEMDNEVIQRGQRVLRGLGVPEGSWWVALHVREGNFYGAYGSPRNADPLSYLDAAQAVIDRGGYVIRIGDPGMTSLPPMDGLVDYAHSDVKTDWMDVFIIGCARFLLESDSGPGGVAWLFDVPVAGTNWTPMCQGLLNRQDIRIPKLIMKGSPPVALSFNSVLDSEQLRDLHTPAAFLEAGVIWQDNTSDEIRALAVEMMDRLEGVAEYEPRDEKLQHCFQELVLSQKTPQTYGTMSKVGRDFLRTHASLFQDEGVLTSVQ
jgi:putative glycosyltransferase (TIGR04372 family)